MPTPLRSPKNRILSIKPCLTLLVTAVVLGVVPSAFGFKDLTPAQERIYDDDHLTSTAEGQVLRYRFIAEDKGVDTIEDEVSVNVVKKLDEHRRDLTVDFLSGDARIILPAFDGYRGNPVLIAMLEHSAQEIGKDTGGGTLYFRNRIRDALATDIALVNEDYDFDGRAVSATRIEFKPFAEDTNTQSFSEISQLTYSIFLSEAVPGGVAEIRIQASNDEGAILRRRTLTFIP